MAALAEWASSDRTPMKGRRPRGARASKVGSRSSAEDGAGSRQNQKEHSTASNHPCEASLESPARSTIS
eukprot:scaffold190151_cov31-Tisochrysis_lutea.AAC.2